MELKSKMNNLFKVLKYEEKIDKLVIHNEKLLDGMSVIGFYNI